MKICCHFTFRAFGIDQAMIAAVFNFYDSYIIQKIYILLLFLFQVSRSFEFFPETHKCFFRTDVSKFYFFSNTGVETSFINLNGMILVERFSSTQFN